MTDKDKEANKRAKQRLAERVRDKKLYQHELAAPDFYANITAELQASFTGFTLDYAPNETIITWRDDDGALCRVTKPTRAGALLAAWSFIVPEGF